MLDATIPPKNGTSKERDAFEWRKQICIDHEVAMKSAADIQIRLVTERAERHNEELAETTGVRTKVQYEVGEWVWLFHTLVKKGLTRKLAHLWHGPYEVESRLSDVAYKLKLPDPRARAFPIVHISRLKPYVSRAVRPTEDLGQAKIIEMLDESLLPEDSWEPAADEDIFEVEEILDDRTSKVTRNGKHVREYLVKWVGYEETTWEPEDELSCTALLYEYDSRVARRRREAAAQDAEESSGSEDEE
jgi:hypothetical protein